MLLTLGVLRPRGIPRRGHTRRWPIHRLLPGGIPRLRRDPRRHWRVACWQIIRGTWRHSRIARLLVREHLLGGTSFPSRFGFGLFFLLLFRCRNLLCSKRFFNQLPEPDTQVFLLLLLLVREKFKHSSRSRSRRGGRTGSALDRLVLRVRGVGGARWRSGSTLPIFFSFFFPGCEVDSLGISDGNQRRLCGACLACLTLRLFSRAL